MTCLFAVCSAGQMFFNAHYSRKVQSLFLGTVGYLRSQDQEPHEPGQQRTEQNADLGVLDDLRVAERQQGDKDRHRKADAA